MSDISIDMLKIIDQSAQDSTVYDNIYLPDNA